MVCALTIEFLSQGWILINGCPQDRVVDIGIHSLMLKHDSQFLNIQALHISDCVVVDVICDCEFNMAALVVEQVIHEVNPLTICV